MIVGVIFFIYILRSNFVRFKSKICQTVLGHQVVGKLLHSATLIRGIGSGTRAACYHHVALGQQAVKFCCSGTLASVLGGSGRWSSCCPPRGRLGSTLGSQNERQLHRHDKGELMEHMPHTEHFFVVHESILLVANILHHVLPSWFAFRGFHL